MLLHRISAAVVATALAATFTTTSSALAAPAPRHDPVVLTTASFAAKTHAPRAPRRHVVRVKVTVGERSSASTEGAQQEETFTCDIDYGIKSSKPVYKKHKITAYDVDFGISFECPLAMFMTTNVFITDLTNHKNLGKDAEATYAESIDDDSSARLPVKDVFNGTYMLAATLPYGFVWISSTSPTCGGIGTPVAICTFLQLGITV